MMVVELRNSLRSPMSHDVRKWLQQLPQQLKDTIGIKKCNDSDSIGTKQVNARLNKITEQRADEITIPVFASFAGVDNLGHAVSNAGTKSGKRKILVIGGSELDIRARAAFRARNGFEAMYEHSTVTSEMFGGIYIVVSGAPCVAYSRAGARRGRSSKLGMMYIDQIDVYIEAGVPVIILEQVTCVLEILDTDKVSKADHVCAQTKVEDKLITAGYQVTHKVINSAEYGAPVSRERLITIAVRSDLAAKKQFEWPIASTPKGTPNRERKHCEVFLG
jgi:site-specific DNA-cytosine methylase